MCKSLGLEGRGTLGILVVAFHNGVVAKEQFIQLVKYLYEEERCYISYTWRRYFRNWAYLLRIEMSII